MHPTGWHSYLERLLSRSLPAPINGPLATSCRVSFLLGPLSNVCADALSFHLIHPCHDAYSAEHIWWIGGCVLDTHNISRISCHLKMAKSFWHDSSLEASPPLFASPYSHVVGSTIQLWWSQPLWAKSFVLRWAHRRGRWTDSRCGRKKNTFWLTLL